MKRFMKYFVFSAAAGAALGAILFLAAMLLAVMNAAADDEGFLDENALEWFIRQIEKMEAA